MKPQIRWEDVPLYEVSFDEETQGIQRVSLVKSPAIEDKGKYFSEQVEMEFSAIPEKQIVVGYAMIPNKKIIREDELGYPFYVEFSAATIRSMVNKFRKDNSNRDINLEHTDTMIPGFIQGDWITESEQYDKCLIYGKQPKLGGWFIEMKIEDKDFIDQIVKGEKRMSFSIEGTMDYVAKYSKIEIETDINKVIDNLSTADLYDIYVSINDIPVHPHCRCEVDNFTWLIMPGACKECRGLQKEYNRVVMSGDKELADMIFRKHKGLS